MIINQLLDKNKIHFSEASRADEFGRVFFYEGRVFRAINKDQKDNCIALVQSDLYTELYKESLIPRTWITDYCVEGFSLVLEHEFVYESKPHHWSFTMYKDAALLILKVNKICNKYGYELKDAHLYNVFFKNNYPIFIDFGSVIKRKSLSGWIAYEQFLSFCYLQLVFWNKPDFFLARKLIEDGNYPQYRTIPMTNLFDSLLMNLVKDDFYEYKHYFRGRLVNTNSVSYKYLLILSKIVYKLSVFFLKKPVRLLSSTKKLIKVDLVEKKINTMYPSGYQSTWSNYHNVYKVDNKINSTPRFNRIIELVKLYAADAKTAIDLAGNQGIFCNLLTQSMSFKRVILTDYDENAIDTAYKAFKADNINIQPYLFNFMRPLHNDEIYKLKSEVVFALAVTHHLILSQHFVLSVILNQIGSYSSKYIFIEFMPVGLWGGGNEFPSVPEWYNLNWFRAEFEDQFTLLHEEQLEVNRVLFIGKKK